MKELMLVCGMWFSIVFLTSFITGLDDARSLNKRCERPMLRAEYFIPGYQFGCWLGSAPNRKGTR